MTDSPTYPPEPQHGWTSDVRDIRIIDGDTIEVTVERKIVVRLLDCWAAENNTAEGRTATDFLREWAAGRQNWSVYIPASDRGEARDLLTFGRALGYVYGDGKNVSELMVAEGHATATREG